MALSQNEINNITFDYITRYNLNKERDEKTIKEILINKGNNFLFFDIYVLLKTI